MLRFAKHQNMVQIRLKNTRTGVMVKELERILCRTGDQSDEPFSATVAEAIRQFILQQHPDDQGDNVGIDTEVQVEIRTPNVPGLDLIDLPGILSHPKVTRKQTKELAARMPEEDHILVLAVVSARSESLRNNGIWKLLRKARRKTVVVLTKVDKGGDEGIEDRLKAHEEGEIADIDLEKIVPVVDRDSSKIISA